MRIVLTPNVTTPPLPIHVPLGDVNVDGAVNGLDVHPFIIVLLDGPYQIEADMNLDGGVNGLDVNPFADAVIGGGEDLSGLLRCGEQTVPEPSTLLLALLALGVVGGSRKWKRAAWSHGLTGLH